jgi:hypothetical protein
MRVEARFKSRRSGWRECLLGAEQGRTAGLGSPCGSRPVEVRAPKRPVANHDPLAEAPMFAEPKAHSLARLPLTRVAGRMDASPNRSTEFIAREQVTMRTRERMLD